MMTIKYRNTCFDIEILVKYEPSDAAAPYRVNVQSAKNPLSFGNTLAVADSEEKAVKMAEQLCGFYAKAREKGYYLKGKVFVKPDHPDISAGEVLENNLSGEELDLMLAE
ncbi:hypothetical protein [Paenibacillus beijingensis]|uniref:hypothetical protein n=1 Tax=Paenibacillus beijingensis TaxID=1126833 RepID=UPI0011DDCDE0|nr:hypothetical protein [Paenibacillus beijingensis]